MNRSFLALLISILFLALTACNSSSPPVSDDLLPENNPPTVILPEWVIVNSGESVNITAEIQDNDSTTFTYSWTQIQGIEVNYSQNTSGRLTVTAPTVTQLQQLRFELTVTDSRGGVGSDFVDVYITQPNTGLIQGKVISASDGSPIVNATVSAENSSSITNSEGRYVLFDLTYNPNTIVNVEHADYSRQSQIVAVSAEEANVNLTISLIPAELLTFDASENTTLTLTNSSASVTFSANTLADSSGNIYSGEVNAKLSAIDTSSNVYLMPGAYLTITGAPIETFGGINIELFDASGAPLQLIQGETFSATFNVGTSSNQPISPATIYGYDFSTGYWSTVASGSISNGQYQVTANELTSLAAGVQYNYITITGCVVDLVGNPISNITVKTEGLNHSGTTRAFTDSAGDFSILTRQYSQVLLFASRGGSVSNTNLITAASEDMDLPTCFTLSEGAVRVKLSWGSEPLDLDSHLVGPNYHVSFRDTGSLTQFPYAQLDVDDTDGEGPEIITISQFPEPGEYAYSVYNYSQSQDPGITDSPTVVELNMDGDTREFTPPSGEGDNLTWNVFTLIVDEDGNVTVEVNNTWSQSEPN